MTNNEPTTLVDEKLAVSLFLDSLLLEPALVEDSAKDTTKEKSAAEVVVLSPATLEKAEVEVQTTEKVETADNLNDSLVVGITKESASSQLESAEIQTTESTVAEWATAPFQVLLFNVAGLNLAVPLVELCGVIKWDGSKVTEMPGHADFYMGILRHLEFNIPVIDTAKMVLPEDKLTHLVDKSARERAKHVVLIGDHEWGLTCDKIGEVITVKPDEVRWRKSKSRRSWLAGTVVEHMCALLNAKGLAQLLVKGHEENET